MLRTPTPFPQVGSYALIEIDGRHHLARIQHRTHGGDAVISLPLMPDVASGNRTVGFDALVDGTPLSEFDRGELARLDEEIARTVRPNRARQAKVDALRARDINSRSLAEMLQRLPDPARRASREAA